MDAKELKEYGPLGALIGRWQGDKGDDIAPGDDLGKENNKYREEILFEPCGATFNHEQRLMGVHYALHAWRLTETKPFHEESGYLLWDEKEKLIIRSTIIPRGMTVLAGGKAEADAKQFIVSAKLGSPVFGICSNPYLDKEFKTLAFDHTLKVLGPDQISYEQDTQIQIAGQKEIFHHTDKNVLKKVG
jgi:hypothetical protein